MSHHDYSQPMLIYDDFECFHFVPFNDSFIKLSGFPVSSCPLQHVSHCAPGGEEGSGSWLLTL